MSSPPSADPARQDVWLIRHGATEWSQAGQYTSVTDLPLLPVGEAAARQMKARVAEQIFARVLTSPRQRARRTAELAGFPDADVDERLVEWAYGDYEGLTSAQIRQSVPGWTLWSHPVPNGESSEHVTARLDAVIADLRELHGPALVFGHGHALRAFAARWLGLEVRAGKHLVLGTATLSVLGWDKWTPAIERWNA
ncbi:MAG: histidine phosphatase family protein [Actinomycetota bacterium]|nr:histidine phosphatase family protein [Actinomycetota bacterium]